MPNIRDRLAAVKLNISIVDVLKSYGITVPLNTETQLSCPFHGEDTHPSARVYASTNTLFCWTCHKVYDVVAVEMFFTGNNFNDSLNSLLATFSVKVDESPQEIQKFYGLVARYTYGDRKQSEALFTDFGYKFCKFYQQIENWRDYYTIIDYFWQEYDKLYDKLQAGEIEANTLLEKAAVWFSDGHGALSIYSQQAITNTAGPDTEEIDTDE